MLFNQLHLREYLGSTIIYTNHYNGTLFRFPFHKFSKCLIECSLLMKLTESSMNHIYAQEHLLLHVVLSTHFHLTILQETITSSSKLATDIIYYMNACHELLL